MWVEYFWTKLTGQLVSKPVLLSMETPWERFFQVTLVSWHIWMVFSLVHAHAAWAENDCYYKNCFQKGIIFSSNFSCQIQCSNVFDCAQVIKDAGIGVPGGLKILAFSSYSRIRCNRFQAWDFKKVSESNHSKNFIF